MERSMWVRDRWSVVESVPGRKNLVTLLGLCTSGRCRDPKRMIMFVAPYLVDSVKLN